MNIQFSDFNIKYLDKVNILLGKNGSGKSTLLTRFELELRSNGDYHIKYVTPERAGTLKYDPNVEVNIESIDSWLSDSRRKNQATQFKQQSISQYRKLQILYYQELDPNMEQRKD